MLGNYITDQRQHKPFVEVKTKPKFSMLNLESEVSKVLLDPHSWPTLNPKKLCPITSILTLKTRYKRHKRPKRHKPLRILEAALLPAFCQRLHLFPCREEGGGEGNWKGKGDATIATKLDV